MKSGFYVAIAVAMSMFLAPGLHGQGSLTPPGAPAPSMKSLAQIEPRTPISSVPFTISTPGAFYLTTNVTTAVSNAIVINVSGVTLDLNGFTISSTVPNAANGGTGILMNGALNDVAIYNGHIVSGVTLNAGVYSGSGFNNGIFYPTNVTPKNIRVTGVTVVGCLGYGIGLPPGAPTLVESCNVQTAGFLGIAASIVKNCTAMGCGQAGIQADTVSDSVGQGLNSTSFGIYTVFSANNCIGLCNGGYGIYGVTANDCFGFATNGLEGIYVDIAVNCRGVANTGYGVYGSRMAVNCFGTCSNGVAGVAGDVVQNCWGTADAGSGNGIKGVTIVNSVGYGATNGIYVQQGGVVSQCQATGSWNGIYADTYSKVADCHSYQNVQYGILLKGYNMVTGNFVTKNYLSGIYGNASNGNYIDGNVAVQNNTSNTGAQGGIGLINCTNNIIIRNSATGNLIAGFNVTGVNATGGYLSVAGTTISSTSPWVNFIY